MDIMEVYKAMNWQKDGMGVGGDRRSDKESKWIIKRSYVKTNKQSNKQINKPTNQPTICVIKA